MRQGEHDKCIERRSRDIPEKQHGSWLECSIYLITRPREHCFDTGCRSHCGARKMIYPITTLDSNKAETRVELHKAYSAIVELCSYILVSFRLSTYRSSDVAHGRLCPSTRRNTDDDRAPPRSWTRFPGIRANLASGGGSWPPAPPNDKYSVERRAKHFATMSLVAQGFVSLACPAADRKTAISKRRVVLARCWMHTMCRLACAVVVCSRPDWTHPQYPPPSTAYYSRHAHPSLSC